MFVTTRDIKETLQFISEAKFEESLDALSHQPSIYLKGCIPIADGKRRGEILERCNFFLKELQEELLKDKMQEISDANIYPETNNPISE